MQPKTDKMTAHLISRDETFRIVLKSISLFLLVSILFQITDPVSVFGHFSLYNFVVPGRQRLPFNDYVSVNQAYNISITRLEPMIASHVVASPKAPDEYRVIFLGDSALWGYLLAPNETLSSQINARNYTLPDGRTVRAYNLGYPYTSVEKDLLILDAVLENEPDMVVWFITLSSLDPEKCDELHPMLIDNIERWKRLQEKYGLEAIGNPCPDTDIELFKWRRPLADAIRLQILSVPWGFTGVDYYWPKEHLKHANKNDFDYDVDNAPISSFPKERLKFKVIKAGIKHARDIPVLIVSEPIFIADGRNSQVFYNSYYQKFPFDLYRKYLGEFSESSNCLFVDLWNALPKSLFSNTPLHLTPKGTNVLGKIIGKEIMRIYDASRKLRD